MSENQQPIQRWYEEDPIVLRCVTLLEGLDDSIKRKTATYLMDEIINKPPYCNMLPDEIFSLITSETRRRRWYDFDEVIRIFVELLRYSPNEDRKNICIASIKFMENLMSAQ